MNASDIIKNFETELLQPEIRKSTERLDELIADEFTEIGESGKQYNKRDIFDALPKQSGIKFFLSNFKATEISFDVVLATFELEKEISESGEKIMSLRSSIWKNKDGRWQIIYHQGTPLKS